MLYKGEFFKFFVNRNKVQVFLRDVDYHEEGVFAEYEVISGDAKSSAISFDKLYTAENEIIGLPIDIDLPKNSKIVSYFFAQSEEVLGEILGEHLSKNDNYDVGIIQAEVTSLFAAHEAACFVVEMLREETTVLLQGLYNESLGDTIHCHIWLFQYNDGYFEKI